MLSRRELLKLGAAAVAAPSLWTGSPLLAAEPYDDAVFVDGPPPLPWEGAFTIAVLPDTQHYSEHHPATYLAQTRWLVEQKSARNISCVLHLGDITNRNTPAEWDNAVAAMTQLDAHLPYFMAVGNHDYSEGGGCRDRTTRFNDYFPIAKHQASPNFGGVYDREPERCENNFHTFAAGGRDFLVLALEFGPRKDVVRWANEVVDAHAGHEAILITHAYMYYDETRYNWKKYGDKQSWNPHAYKLADVTNGDVTDGEELWQGLITQHDNFILTLNGHVLNDGLGKTVTPTPGGREVPQVLVNFQMKPHGGDGWLRLLECRPDRTVQTWDYSPTRNQCNASEQNQFVLTLPG